MSSDLLIGFVGIDSFGQIGNHALNLIAVQNLVLEYNSVKVYLQ